MDGAGSEAGIEQIADQDYDALAKFSCSRQGDALDKIDDTPFGKVGKLFDAMADDAQRSVNERNYLVEVLRGLVLVCGRTGNSFEDFEDQAEVYHRETGRMRPGKDVSAASGDDSDFETRRLKYAEWVQSKIQAAREALSAHSLQERQEGS